MPLVHESGDPLRYYWASVKREPIDEKIENASATSGSHLEKTTRAEMIQLDKGGLFGTMSDKIMAWGKHEQSLSKVTKRQSAQWSKWR